jgi:hypothetical protein
MPRKLAHQKGQSVGANFLDCLSGGIGRFPLLSVHSAERAYPVPGEYRLRSDNGYWHFVEPVLKRMASVRRLLRAYPDWGVEPAKDVFEIGSWE